MRKGGSTCVENWKKVGSKESRSQNANADGLSRVHCWGDKVAQTSRLELRKGMCESEGVLRGLETAGTGDNPGRGTEQLGTTFPNNGDDTQCLTGNSGSFKKLPESDNGESENRRVIISGEL
ncbi:UNVERIFIED_CONTAM: hypothetical protein FKN15_077614 [Acipenser sinensis]